MAASSGHGRGAGAGAGAGEGAPPRRDWSLEEIEERLVGYIEVPPERLDSLKWGTHVRYYVRTPEGAEEYRPGGFIKANPVDTVPRGGREEKRFLRLHNGFNEKAPGYQSWMLAYEDVVRLYAKADAFTQILIGMLEGAIAGFNANIKKLVARINEHSERLEALEGARDRSRSREGPRRRG